MRIATGQEGKDLLCRTDRSPFRRSHMHPDRCAEATMPPRDALWALRVAVTMRELLCGWRPAATTVLSICINFCDSVCDAMTEDQPINPATEKPGHRFPSGFDEGRPWKPCGLARRRHRLTQEPAGAP